MVDLEALKKEHGLPPRHSAALRDERLTMRYSKKQQLHFRFTMLCFAAFLVNALWLVAHGHATVGGIEMILTLLAMAVVVMAHHWYRDILEEEDA